MKKPKTIEDLHRKHHFFLDEYEDMKETAKKWIEYYEDFMREHRKQYLHRNGTTDGMDDGIFIETKAKIEFIKEFFRVE